MLPNSTFVFINMKSDTTPFVAIPEWLCERHGEISAGAILTYGHLRKLAVISESDQVFPSKNYLADKLNVTAKTVQKYIKELRELGLITVIGRVGDSNKYMFKAHKWMPSLFIAGLAVRDLLTIDPAGMAGPINAS